MFKEHNFTHAILLKNSFSSALAVFLAQIPSRIGYARQGRGVFLTEQLLAPRLPNGEFKPAPMVDYYLAIASWLGAETMDRSLELITDSDQASTLSEKLPQIFNPGGPVVVLVPGGAYGPSKYWLPERFAQTADWLIDNYEATVVVSVSADPTEKQIADHICNLSRHELVNLGQNAVSLGQLKSLFSVADLVITNDTGPRHIAIALGRKVISLFGPNNPLWTDTGYEDEIKIVGQAPCVPCTKPTCKENEHLCMQAITVDMVCDAAKKLLEAGQDQQPV